MTQTFDTPLARRTAAGLVVDDRPALIACAWRGLTSRDGERCEVEWTAHIAGVDTAADRQMLSERFLRDDSATLTAAGATRFVCDSVAATVTRFVATAESSAMLTGECDAELNAAIESDARRACFAAGLRITPPYRLRIDSPSVRQAQDAARAKQRLAELTATGATREAAIARLGEQLVDPASAATAVRAAAHIDPYDLLRAVAATDARWSAPMPLLWIVAGNRLVGIEPGRPTLDRPAMTFDGIGPLRSVRGAMIDGQKRLLVGGRLGVAIVDPESGAIDRTFTVSASGEFGFNAACVLPARGELLATHAELGLVRWSLDAGEPALTSVEGGARSIAAASEQAAVFVDGGGAVWTTQDHGALMSANMSRVVDLSPWQDGATIIADDQRVVAIDGPGGRIGQTRVAASIAAAAAVDLFGVPRAIVATDDGAVLGVDLDSGHAVPIGGGRWPVRTIRTRPGYVALLSSDRLRVALISLASPEAIAAELHIAATLGKRAADVWFA